MSAHFLSVCLLMLFSAFSEKKTTVCSLRAVQCLSIWVFLILWQPTISVLRISSRFFKVIEKDRRKKIGENVAFPDCLHFGSRSLKKSMEENRRKREKRGKQSKIGEKAGLSSCSSRFFKVIEKRRGEKRGKKGEGRSLLTYSLFWFKVIEKGEEGKTPFIV